MALLKKSDLTKMSDTERNAKLNELRLELVKANVIAKKSTAKTKEIKRTIARLITLSKTKQEGKNK